MAQTRSTVTNTDDVMEVTMENNSPVEEKPVVEEVLSVEDGNNTEDQVAVYLDSAETKDQDANWHVCAQFALVMSNPNDPTVFVYHNAHHRFTVDEADWGFTRFTDIRKLEVPFDRRNVPLMDKNRTIITAFVRVYEDPTGVLWHNFVNYDSKAMTGYVGLKNQGATCYMNSLLQSLFFTNYFRKAVFEIPTEDDEPSKSVSLALQRVFYQLTKSTQPVGTTELTRSFGWNSLESFMQHDVQEFNRVLQDNLEGKMKASGTDAEGAIQKLFVGKMKSYIKCIHVNYESSRTENFYDIQLNVKGCKTLRDSFLNYIDVETLDGENKYMAEGHGLQDASKGVIFESLPPVLHLQLKRFEYDIERDTMVKINDRHEFPLEIDLADFVAAGEQKEKVGPGGYVYSLHGVLVHSGDLHGGHYFALLKPERDGKWFKFDDDRVTPVTNKEVLDDNYGGGEQIEPLGANVTMAMRQLNRHKRFTNAYMLVYIQNSAMDEVLKPVSEADIPEHLQRRLDDERALAESKRKERDESLLNLNARVISDEDFKNHGAFDLFNPISPTAGKQIKIKRADNFNTFKAQVAQAYNLGEDQIRIWNLVKRQNDTIRTDIPIPETDGTLSMDAINSRHGTRGQNEFRCYVEFAEQRPDGKPHWLPAEPQTGNIMIFIKYYDPVTSTMEGLGHMFVHKLSKVNDIVPQLLERKGLPRTTNLKLFEEIKPTMIEPMKMKTTFHQCEIQGGDIIVFQKELTPKELTDLNALHGRAMIPQYFEYIFNRITVEFKPKNSEDPSAETYTVELSKKSNYDQVAQALAEKLGVDLLHLQFSSASQPGGQPKAVIRRAANVQLHEMLAQGFINQGVQPCVLYYEKLDMSIVELESKRLIKVTWLGPGMKEEVHELLLPRSSTLQSLLEAMLPKIKPPLSGSQKLRIFGTYSSKHARDFGPGDPLAAVHDSLSVYMEELPMEEVEMSPEDHLIHCFHFTGDPSRMHGVPFRMVIKKDEPFGEMKQRIRTRIGMNEKDFAKVKFVLHRTQPAVMDTLNDDDILSHVDLQPSDSIGLDHVDKNNRVNRFGTEKAIFIRG
ncbi:hypothetical protein DFQ27_001479 [Actinomortierella ambigua]|uniref:ubiquitinyl hydrolase 1 n=1 Tax=Actinomortierella ambigua TaxID=1343610 RepID=A0A9P6QNB5_9FUNG|nr:hypothetical protein DFQ27_001479 [Actinomortierella ambigua]